MGTLENKKHCLFSKENTLWSYWSYFQLLSLDWILGITAERKLGRGASTAERIECSVKLPNTNVPEAMLDPKTASWQHSANNLINYILTQSWWITPGWKKESSSPSGNTTGMDRYVWGLVSWCTHVYSWCMPRAGAMTSIKDLMSQEGTCFLITTFSPYGCSYGRVSEWCKTPQLTTFSTA